MQGSIITSGLVMVLCAMIPMVGASGCFYCSSQDYANDICLPFNKMCDGQDDCEDGSDEWADYCSCGSHDCFHCANEYMSISGSLKCDRVADCSDGSDESDETCRVTTGGPTIGEPTTRGPKTGGPTPGVPRTGRPTTEGCYDVEFQCHDRKECIHKRFRCDDQNDCSDGSDEDEDYCKFHIYYENTQNRGTCKSITKVECEKYATGEGKSLKTMSSSDPRPRPPGCHVDIKEVMHYMEVSQILQGVIYNPANSTGNCTNTMQCVCEKASEKCCCDEKCKGVKCLDEDCPKKEVKQDCCCGGECKKGNRPTCFNKQCSNKNVKKDCCCDEECIGNRPKCFKEQCPKKEVKLQDAKKHPRPTEAVVHQSVRYTDI